jgi:hypothetical protein
VSSPSRREVRIAIRAKYLDEVRIRQADQCAPGSVSYLSFPAHRHWARIVGDRIIIGAQAATVVQLFADGVLPAVGGRGVPVEVGNRKFGGCVLESIESGKRSAVDDIIVLRFRCQEEAGS